MNYFSRYSLDFDPFIKNSKDIVVETNAYNEIIYRLSYLLSNKGFGVITGAPGRGKTTVVRNFIKTLNPSLYKVVYISLSTLTLNEFYRHLAVEMGLEAMSKKSDNFKLIQNEINRHTLEKRITPVIIVDEANYINNAILNDFKMLFNFDMDSQDRAVVLLVGLPTLNNTLRLVANEPLRQRISMNYTLEGLSKEEARNYISSKLNGAKCNTNIFNENALESIINASNGIPRIINKICSSCLIIGNNKELNLIDADIVLHAVNETELD